jgi:DNA-binding NarL/FixJ family response regulator
MKPRRELSPRQREIFKLAERGFCDKEIAGKLYIDEETVGTHFRRILKKLKAKSRLHAGAILSKK